MCSMSHVSATTIFTTGLHGRTASLPRYLKTFQQNSILQYDVKLMKIKLSLTFKITYALHAAQAHPTEI